MKDKFYGINKIQVILMTLYVVLFFGCKNRETDYNEKSKTDIVKTDSIKTQKAEEFAVEAPPFSDGIYPCTDCHANLTPNPVRRKLVDWHDDISAMFNHDSENRWCLDCHDLKNRDYLRLASGKLLDFKESYKLCGQCHGEKYRDWKVGVHGKRTGEWNGKKEYFLCVNCHNPHSPKFQELIPEPPPVRQEDIK
jgi:formate-dependent nitrite reductase cytochrome c552 subunit